MNYYLEGILTWLGRARHACGFGLHSPYAFSMVTGILRDTSSGYYAYYDLPSIASRYGRSECEARSLYRLLLHLRSLLPSGQRPKATTAENSLSASPSFLSEIAALAFPEPLALPPSLLLADTFEGSPEAAAAIVRERLETSPSAFLLCGINRSAAARELRSLLLANPPAGMVFDGWHTLLIVSRQGLPAQTFKVLFPR